MESFLEVTDDGVISEQIHFFTSTLSKYLLLTYIDDSVPYAAFL